LVAFLLDCSAEFEDGGVFCFLFLDEGVEFGGMVVFGCDLQFEGFDLFLVDLHDVFEFLFNFVEFVGEFVVGLLELVALLVVETDFVLEQVDCFLFVVGLDADLVDFFLVGLQFYFVLLEGEGGLLAEVGAVFSLLVYLQLQPFDSLHQVLPVLFRLAYLLFELAAPAFCLVAVVRLFGNGLLFQLQLLFLSVDLGLQLQVLFA
jgi:hypothetical protein